MTNIFNKSREFKKFFALSIAVLAIGAMSVSNAEARAGRHRSAAVAGVAALVGGLVIGNAIANNKTGYNSGYVPQTQYYKQQPVYYGGLPNYGYQAYETVTVYQPVTTYRKVKVKRPVQVQSFDPYYREPVYGNGYNHHYVGW